MLYLRFPIFIRVPVVMIESHPTNDGNTSRWANVPKELKNLESDMFKMAYDSGHALEGVVRRRGLHDARAMIDGRGL